MALSVDFKEWYRKSVFNTSKGGNERFNKLVKRLETLEAGRTVRRVRPCNKRKVDICPKCNGDCIIYNNKDMRNLVPCDACNSTGKRPTVA
jgi:hypothetical protein